LDPAVPQIRNQERECYMHDSLDGVATPAGSRCDCAIRVNLRVLFGRIFPALLKVDNLKGFPPQSLATASVKSVNHVCVSKFIDACMIGQESTLAEHRRARRVDCYDKIPLVCKDVRVPHRVPPIIPHFLRAWKSLFSAYVAQDTRA